jgi:hypothetical protein
MRWRYDVATVQAADLKSALEKYGDPFVSPSLPHGHPERKTWRGKITRTQEEQAAKAAGVAVAAAKALFPPSTILSLTLMGDDPGHVDDEGRRIVGRIHITFDAVVLPEPKPVAPPEPERPKPPSVIDMEGFAAPSLPPAKPPVK